VRVAVDAFNLVADRRGMGRFTRTILRQLPEAGDIELSLIARNQRDAQALRAELPFDVIELKHAKTRSFESAWYPWNGMRFEVAPFSVVTMHDAFAFTQPARDLVGRWKEQHPIRRAAKRARELTAVSHWSASELSRELRIDASRFAITPNVPDPVFSPVAPRANIAPYVFAVGGTDKRKNIALLIDAWDAAFPDRSVALHIAGNLNDADEQCAARCSVQRSRPDDARLRELYAGALLVAVPSTGEGYGLMSVEAMACGAAVLAADAAALPEACDGAALLLPPHDVRAWSEALRSLAYDDARVAEYRSKSLARVARIDRTQSARIIAELLRRSL